MRSTWAMFRMLCLDVITWPKCFVRSCLKLALCMLFFCLLRNTKTSSTRGENFLEGGLVIIESFHPLLFGFSTIYIFFLSCWVIELHLRGFGGSCTSLLVIIYLSGARNKNSSF
jgi:hypothetical protein